MAHFANINENGIVIDVLVVANEYENNGQEYLVNVCGLEGIWIQTSYNTIGNVHTLGGTPLNKNYAGIGYSFDGVGFSAPQPFPSWTLDKETYLWTAPVAMPNDGKAYQWDEAATSWVEIAALN